MVKTAEFMPKLTTQVVIQPRYVPTSWLLFFGTLGVYFLTRTHLNTFDAVAYANQIGLAAQTGKLRPLFHPHHLLFNALGYGVWRLARLLGYGGGPLIVNQRLNAVLGAWGVALFYLILRRLQPLGWMPLVLALGLAGSFGWWICATDGRVNMPSSVLMLATFDGLVRLRIRPTITQAARAGLLAGMAMLFHESAGLFGIVGLIAVFGAATGRMRFRMTAAYGAAWAGVVISAYGLVGLLALHLHSLGEFKHWVNAYAERGWWWDFHIIKNLRLDLFGLRHAVFVEPLGRAALAQTSLRPLGTAALALLWALYGAALLGIIAAGWTIFVSLPKMRRSANWPIASACLSWLALYAAFFTIWCPGAFVFWVPVLIPLGTLLLLARPAPRLLGVWIGVFVLLNFLAGILPYLKPVAGLSQRVALDIKAHTPPRSLIVVSGVGEDAQCEVDIPYFANRPVLSLHGLLAHSATVPAAQASLNKLLAGAFGAKRQVYVLDEVWNAPDSVKGLQKQSPGLDGPHLRSLFQIGTLVPAWTGPRGIVWRLLPLAPAGRSSRAARRIKGDAHGTTTPRRTLLSRSPT
jgi:hypothetical protein